MHQQLFYPTVSTSYGSVELRLSSKHIYKVLIDCLSINIPLDESTILKIPTVYHITIARNLLGLLEGTLMYYESIHTITEHICRIIVPSSLRHTIFNMMHATPISGHIGEYKTLYQIRLRFFCHLLLSDVSD